MVKPKKKTLGLEASTFAKSFCDAAGKLYSLEELLSEAGVDDSKNVCEDDMEKLSSLDSIYSDISRKLIENKKKPVICLKEVGSLVKAYGNVMRGDSKFFARAIYKALLSETFKDGSKISYIKSELGDDKAGKRVAKMLKKAGCKRIKPKAYDFA